MPAKFPPPGIGDPFVPMPPPPAPIPLRDADRPGRWQRPIRRSGVAWGLAIVVTAWCAGMLGVYVGARIESDDTRTVAAPVDQEPAVAVEVGGPRSEALDKQLDVAGVLAQLRPSVVAVSSDISQDGVSGEGVGTGVVITSDGQILTNAHVIEGANEVRVRLAGETEPRLATVIAEDPSNDLALLQIDATGLAAATLADPTTVYVGDEVVAIGYALDLDGEPSITLGIVSALDRTILTENGALDGLIQTDAAISSGNSGGPLVNAVGEVVGINTAVARGDSNNAANNIGFAISMDQVFSELEVLRAQASGEERSSGFLGVQLGDRTDGGSGALIVEVTPDSPAEDAGIEPGDILVEINGDVIEGSAGVIGVIRDREPGDKVTVVIERDGERQSFEITLTDRPEEVG